MLLQVPRWIAVKQRRGFRKCFISLRSLLSGLSPMKHASFRHASTRKPGKRTEKPNRFDTSAHSLQFLWSSACVSSSIRRHWWGGCSGSRELCPRSLSAWQQRWFGRGDPADSPLLTCEFVWFHISTTQDRREEVGGGAPSGTKDIKGKHLQLISH